MKRYQDVALFLLVLAVVAQTLHVIVRADRTDDAMAPAPSVAVGDTVRSLGGYDEDGAMTTIPLLTGPDTLTVVYAFHPECAFCDAVAPDWAAHFAVDDPLAVPVRRIALTRELPGPAATYAERFDWEVNLLSVADSATATTPEAFLVSRTPWIYVFDSDGVLRFQDHGAELESVEQAAAEIASGRVGRKSGGDE